MNAVEALRQAQLYTDEVEYLMLKLHPRAMIAAAGVLAEVADPFTALVVDKDEVTLIIPSEVLEEFEGRLGGAEQSAVLRLITFDLELPPTLTGFMALVAQLLAEANIPIIPLGAYSRDHVLVAASDFDKAWQTLKAYSEH